MQKLGTDKMVTVYITDHSLLELKKDEQDFYRKEKRAGVTLSSIPAKTKREYFLQVRRPIEDLLREKPEFLEYIIGFSTLRNVPPIIVLYSHGDDEDGKWVYLDQEEKGMRPVQDFVRKMDGKYSCIILWLCNPEGATVSTKYSFVMAADTEFYEARTEKTRLTHTSGFNTLFVPERYRQSLCGGDREIDGYTISHHLTKLQALHQPKS